MTVDIALLFPDLLGTYGDSGNSAILAQRLRWRGVDARVLTIRSGEPVPEGCQIYVVGGGEDLPQSLAARQLGAGGESGPLHRAVDAGAVVLAVCAGLQIIGRSFVGPDGLRADGLGLLDCETVRGRGRRSVGEIVVDPVPELGLPTLTGYENHAGATALGPEARPLGRVRVGTGNGATLASSAGPGAAGASVAGDGPTDDRGVDGAWSGKVLGTYLHGPVLARNPALADLLLVWAVGRLDPLDDSESEDLRRERLAAAPAERAGARTVLDRVRSGRSIVGAYRRGR